MASINQIFLEKEQKIEISDYGLDVLVIKMY